MKISKEEAIELAADYIREMVKGRLHVQESCPHGTSYGEPKGNSDDYWYIKMPDLSGRGGFQLDGTSIYLTICKETGEVDSFSVR
ncbi:hypothetical protein [Desulfofustis limnaeus]|uniref:NTF2 fold domain-containing protein n=1 Tax=Desulfofustis limnaeus TaxID=2740163 RepID=A0ABM7WCW1_9BACT|nr:hypothetical protein [Desulfofustis limnaeus]BDD88845.1 hypothetical protein DPPLL_32100 [Desulfofustis limnaeus]